MNDKEHLHFEYVEHNTQFNRGVCQDCGVEIDPCFGKSAVLIKCDYCYKDFRGVKSDV